MSLDTFVRSKTYKNFTAKLYGWGASAVIIGALLKINHWPFATEMLLVGMCTEALIFFVSAFEPLHVEYDWSLAYPELAGMEYSTEEEKEARRQEVINRRKGIPEGAVGVTGSADGSGVSQKLDKMLDDAKIGPELIESLGKGLQNLSDTTKGLGSVVNAAETSESFIKNVSEASNQVTSLTSAYKKTTDYLNKDLLASGEYLSAVQDATSSVTTLANIYKETANTLSVGDASYIDELKTMASSLSSINALYEMQIQNSSAQLEATKNVQERIDNLVTNFADTAENVLKYKEQVNALSKKVGSLNDIYGNMLAAMQVKGQ